MTIPEVFVVESLGIADVKIGSLLCDNLRACGRNPLFMMVKNQEEFKKSLLIFKASNYRFLHIICHGNASHVTFHDAFSEKIESIEYNDFTDCFPNGLDGIRIFLAACELGNQFFSNMLMQKKHSIYSVVAPENEILAEHALYTWSTFFNQIYLDASLQNMRSAAMLQCLWKSVKIFNSNFHASIVHPDPRHRYIAHHHLRPFETVSYKEPYTTNPM